ncbi:hypothetical protein HHK36_001820 [Tetracentron sinense]|uniref:HTH myb-type domain-containing protein n=1 Tax=Tetracentron sinense TaxID=13715 RepID=A0A835A3D0_TETSI|nr:hypothetical protein HHK36_001820 [Tetracentron sinense]
MIAVSPLRNPRDEKEGEMESFLAGADEFLDFASGNLLDGIDFDDLFIGFDDGDVLPDLVLDPEMLAEFSVTGGEEPEMNLSGYVGKVEEEDKVSGSASGSGSSSSQGEEILSKRDERVKVSPSSRETDKGRKSSAQSKASQGKRKVKVDWTPELHRRFVQAVEQLGVDKAVPSRILELMGIDCLTRHNIASHLQRFVTPPVPGIPPHAMYKVDHGISVPTGKSDSQPPFEFHPSKESIDSAIGDVISKPWLPLPLGLKPPSLESVLVELQRQGVPKIPPSS